MTYGSSEISMKKHLLIFNQNDCEKSTKTYVFRCQPKGCE